MVKYSVYKKGFAENFKKLLNDTGRPQLAQTFPLGTFIPRKFWIITRHHSFRCKFQKTHFSQSKRSIRSHDNNALNPETKFTEA